LPDGFRFAKKLEKMEHMIERAKSCGIACSSVERKLRQLIDIIEDEAYFHTRQSARLYHLGAQTAKNSPLLELEVDSRIFQVRINSHGPVK
jgi:alpha-1,4-galacturonosyltransferase